MPGSGARNLDDGGRQGGAGSVGVRGEQAARAASRAGWAVPASPARADTPAPSERWYAPEPGPWWSSGRTGTDPGRRSCCTRFMLQAGRCEVRGGRAVGPTCSSRGPPPAGPTNPGRWWRSGDGSSPTCADRRCPPASWSSILAATAGAMGQLGGGVGPPGQQVTERARVFGGRVASELACCRSSTTSARVGARWRRRGTVRLRGQLLAIDADRVENVANRVITHPVIHRQPFAARRGTGTLTAPEAGGKVVGEMSSNIPTSPTAARNRVRR